MQKEPHPHPWAPMSLLALNWQELTQKCVLQQDCPQLQGALWAMLSPAPVDTMVLLLQTHLCHVASQALELPVLQDRPQGSA